MTYSWMRRCKSSFCRTLLNVIDFLKVKILFYILTKLKPDLLRNKLSEKSYNLVIERRGVKCKGQIE